jgi:2-polyprenyl-6-hydroxyphenyl methylase/3-demethylubiquinone-9 3-methyltransferase
MKNDLALYDDHAAEWWNPESPAFRSLHRVKGFALELLREWLAGELPGATLVDLGCGGGLLAEALAREGAFVIGVDRSRASLLAAARHAAEQRASGCSYLCADLEHTPLSTGIAHIALLSDVIEHLEHGGPALDEAQRLLAPGGKLFVSTLNCTWRARILAVTVAEGLRLVPRGTHDPRLFVSPERLARDAAERGLRLVRLQGAAVRPLATLRAWAVELRRSRDTSVAYSALFEKSRART